MIRLSHILKDIAYLLIPYIGICVFFFRLFFPSSSLFMIPDFGLSDVLHLNLPLKSFLHESLINHEWPLWNPWIGTGFPSLAEGQIGTFFLPNLLLFRFFSLIPAYNLSLVFTYVLASTGMYAFCRAHSFSRPISTWCASIFCFSGFFSTHLNHINLIQTSALLPLVWLSFYRILKKPTYLSAVFLGCILSQQIFAGYIPITFVTLCSVSLYFSVMLINVITSRKSHHVPLSRILLWTSIGIMIACSLSAIQILPTFELWQKSTRQSGLSYTALTFFPYPIKHFITFLMPYFFGSPADGTYGHYSDMWGIFWENTAYIGVVPLCISILGIIKGKGVEKRAWIICLLACISLVPGKFSPVYFLFSFFPFTLFRVPSRFLISVSAILCICCGYGASWIYTRLQRSRQKGIWIFILVCICVAGVLDEYRFSYMYPPTSPSDWWTEEPKTVSYIKKHITQEKERIYNIGSTVVWNDTFTSYGWKSMDPYRAYREGLYPNENILFHLYHADAYPGGLTPTRFISARLIIFQGKDELSGYHTAISISTMSARLLSYQRVRYILSPFELRSPNLSVEMSWDVDAPNSHQLYLYRNETISPRPHLVYWSTYAKTLSDASRQLQETPQNKTVTVVEKKQYEIDEAIDATGSATILHESNTHLDIHAISTQRAIMVLPDAYDLGWKGYLDGKEATIFPVNINSRGMMIPAGKHTINMDYHPNGFFTGRFITYLSMGFLFFSVLFRAFYKSFNSDSDP